MTHAEMDELYELYVLGALETEQAAEIDGHVSTSCEYCLQHIRDAKFVTAAMIGIAEPVEPPADLRRRVVAMVKPERRSRGWMFAVAGLTAVCAALLAVAIWSANSLSLDQREIVSLRIERTQLREAVQILSRSETRTVRFGVAENQPHGRVFVNRHTGVVFVGSQLPELAADRTFQLWLVPGTGAPQSAGLFRPNATGEAVSVRSTPVDTTRYQAVAVSIEPRGGSPAPSTKPIIVIPLS